MMLTPGKILYWLLVFPGFLFTAFAGLFVSWIDRKVTARVQWRVGPPWYQPFADIIKLLGKETIIPDSASRGAFLLAPILGLAATIVAATTILMANIRPDFGFVGDLIVIIYLLTIPAIATIIGGSASGNPISSIGVSREIKLVLAYELPFILALVIPIIKVGNQIQLGAIIIGQSNGAVITSLSGIIGFIVAFFCIQAKLGLVPFDLAEAETEIIAGPYTEYSGAPLAIFKLTKAMLLVVLPVFLITVFWAGMGASAASVLKGILKYLFVVVLIVLVRNTNPRVRIDQAIKFFWGPMSILAVLGIILAFMGL